MPTSPACVEANLLYARPVELPFEAMLGELNSAFADRYVALARRPDTPDGVAIYSSSDMHVRIECGGDPIDPERFMNALKAPITQLNPADFRGPVLGHSAHATVTVSAGPISMHCPEALYEDIDPYQETLEGAETRLLIGRFLLDRIVATARPLAVYWALSDKLLTAEEIRALRRDPFPLPLFVTPNLFSSGEVIEGTRVVGFQAVGSEYLIGKRVIFNEAPLPYAHLLRRTYEFIAYCRARGEVIPDGDSFGASSADIIRVRQKDPTDVCPSGAVELTYEKVGTEALAPTIVTYPNSGWLSRMRTELALLTEGNKPFVTYALCAVSLACIPLLGAAVTVYNVAFGPRLRPTGLVAALALLMFLSGASVSAWMGGWGPLLATLERAPSPVVEEVVPLSN